MKHFEPHADFDTYVACFRQNLTDRQLFQNHFPQMFVNFLAPFTEYTHFTYGIFSLALCTCVEFQTTVACIELNCEAEIHKLLSMKSLRLITIIDASTFILNGKSVNLILIQTCLVTKLQLSDMSNIEEYMSRNLSTING